MVINPNQEVFNQRTVDNGKKTGVYFPRAAATTGKTINYALLSHAFAKSIVGESFDFDSYLKSAKASEVLKINSFE